MRTYVHTYIHTYIIHTYMHTYIHTYTHTYIHTYTHTCMHTYIHRGVGTGPAGPATAGSKFPEPTIKNIIPLFVIKQIRNFCITVACLHRFNKGIILLYYRKNKTLIFFKPHLHYELGACKNNSRSLREMLSNKLPRHFY